MTRQRAARISVCVATRGTIEGRHRLVGLIFQLPRRPEISERIQYTRCCYSRAKFSVAQPIYLFASVAVQQPVAFIRAHFTSVESQITLSLCINCLWIWIWISVFVTAIPVVVSIAQQWVVQVVQCTSALWSGVIGGLRRQGSHAPELGPQQVPGEAVWCPENARKHFGGRCYVPGPAWGANSAPSDPLAGGRGSLLLPPQTPRPLSALKASSFSPSILTLSSLTWNRRLCMTGCIRLRMGPQMETIGVLFIISM